MMTETLAKIYQKQGKYDKALEIYNTLRLKFPEKNAYFAALIEKLEKEK
jgi:tetratricopeptide (TPR) repeat protein